MGKFLNTYMSSHMVGIDYDIESGQTPAQINALLSATAYAQSLYPNLRFSFTLATLAASVASPVRRASSAPATIASRCSSARIGAYCASAMSVTSR